jgi:hypothetical protein
MAGIPYPALPLADVCFSYFLGFSALKGNGLPASIPSLLLHGWAPAGFLRGFCRLAVSIGIVMEKGKAYQPGESLCQESIFYPAGIWSKGTGKRCPWCPEGVFLTENAPAQARPSCNGDRTLPIPVYYPFFSMYPI